MRIAVIKFDRCKPKDCNFLCFRICPKVRTGNETIIIDQEKNKPIIQEDLCSGCGICIKKCPFEAITIVNLPEEIGKPVHQYGINGFRLYNLPTPRDGVVGILGENGIGKTTLLKILAGDIKPNFGEDNGVEWNEIIERFRGKEIQPYLKSLLQKKIKAVYKPQFVDLIPRYYKGKKVNELLERDKEVKKEKLNELIKKLNLENSLEKNVEELSGGELQKVAIAGALMKDADVYLIDEPSAYLDVEERLNVAKVIRDIKKKIFVVEHDLIVLDYISDYVHILYGTSGAYGIVSNIKSVRVGINEYLSGFLRAEKMRFRDEEIKFDLSPEKELKGETYTLVSYPNIEKNFKSFKLEINSGYLNNSETVGILGANATGKTTFVKILASEIKPDNHPDFDLGIDISYKPQYIQPENKKVSSLKLNSELIKKFNLRFLMEKNLNDLSGGELQRVFISACLSKDDADIYILDEPSAYLDVEERLKFAHFIKKFAHEKKTSILIVDHDLLLIDYLSNKVMVFFGEPGEYGKASQPLSLREGMNKFLKSLGLTFRRDPETSRPRANKIDSVKDREQKEKGEYYYVG